MANNVPGAQAITRAIQLLKMFDDSHPRWDLTALADATDLNKTTVFRILSALEGEGLIERTKTARICSVQR
jgi:DNA-binding IclR family transcriptional regulator